MTQQERIMNDVMTMLGNDISLYVDLPKITELTIREVLNNTNRLTLPLEMEVVTAKYVSYNIEKELQESNQGNLTSASEGGRSLTFDTSKTKDAIQSDINTTRDEILKYRLFIREVATTSTTIPTTPPTTDDDITAHINNSTIHVTSQDKVIWNSKLDSIPIEYTNHINNSVIHVTQQDKTAWNNKLDTVPTEYTTHINDIVIHVTQADKDKWNSGTGTGGTSQEVLDHIANNTIHVTSNDKTSWNGHMANNDLHVTSVDKSTWNTHISNNNIHITSTERTNVVSHINNNDIHTTKTEKDTTTQHINDTVKHLTQLERDNIATHISNGDIHVTQQEKDKWNTTSGGSGIVFEKGTWAPRVFWASTNNDVMNYTVRYGSWYRVDDFVTILFNASGTWITGDGVTLTIDGLPFVPNLTNLKEPAVHLALPPALANGSSAKFITSYIDSTGIAIKMHNAGNNKNNISRANLNTALTWNISGTATYEILI